MGGQPFDQLRTGGWSWLHEGDRLDQHMLCAIVDVAHMVAALSAPHEEILRLDLAAVAAAEGHESEAERILREDVCDRSDEGEAPMELSDAPRTSLPAKTGLPQERPPADPLGPSGCAV